MASSPVKWALESITTSKASGDDRFKGLDLVDRVTEEVWTEVCNIVQEVVTKTIPKEKKCKKTKLRSPDK